MSRYVNDVPTSMSPDEVERTIAGYLGSEGFQRARRGSEEVWKKGMGLMMGPQFIKADRVNGNVHIEAWTTVAALPGLYVGEMGTRGVVGFTAKRMLRQRVTRLEGLLHDAGGEARPAEAPREAPRPHEAAPQQAARAGAPSCSSCGKALTGGESILGAGAIVFTDRPRSQTDLDSDYALFHGSICFGCRMVFCTDCLGDRVDRCPRCGGETKPAYGRELKQLAALA